MFRKTKFAFHILPENDAALIFAIWCALEKIFGSPPKQNQNSGGFGSFGGEGDCG
eukprot:Awhi_evm1s7705